MLFKVSNLNSNLAVTLGYLVPASNNSALENKILTEPQPEKAKLLYCIRKSKLFFLMLNRGSIYLKAHFYISSLWNTWKIGFSQSHSLKRLSGSVASGRPNCSLLNACHALSSMLPLGLVLFIKLKAGHHHLFSTTLKCIQGRS